MSQDLKFVTSVSGQTSKGLVLRGEDLTELINEADFVSTLFLSLVGRKPNRTEKIVLNSILVSAIDHGISPASGFVPRVVASSGGDVLSAMAATLLALGPYHGAAVTGSMDLFMRVSKDGDDIEKSCEKIIEEYVSQKNRVPGFGHPIYNEVDPRAKELFEVARKNNLDIQFMNIARQMEHSLEEKLNYKINKKLVLNIDGAIAALLLTIGIEPAAGNAVFAVSKVAGSVAHIIEEQKSENWVRRINEQNVEYNK